MLNFMGTSLTVRDKKQFYSKLDFKLDIGIKFVYLLRPINLNLFNNVLNLNLVNN